MDSFAGSDHGEKYGDAGVVTRKQFRDATPFMSHFVHTFTKIERCLNSDELKALDYEVSSSGVWRAAIATQLLPSQVNRLASVRQELEAFERSESAIADTVETESPDMGSLGGGVPSYPPQNVDEIEPINAGETHVLSRDLGMSEAAAAGRVDQIRLTFRRCREGFPGNFRPGARRGGLGVTWAL